MPEELTLLLAAWGVSPSDVLSALRATMRVLPTAVILPVLGFGVAATPVRLAFALTFAATLVPVVEPLPTDASIAGALVSELGRGFPVALIASVAVFAGFMAGDLTGGLMAPGRALRKPMSWMLGLVASIAFLEAGGATAVAQRLASLPDVGAGWAGAVDTLARGIGIAVLMAAPLMIVAMLVDVALAIVVRADPRGAWHVAVRTGRPVVVALCAALLLERVAELVVALP